MTIPVTPLLGAHVSIAGGFALAPERARSIGGNILQIFSGSPRSWGAPRVSKETADSFRRAMRSCGISVGYFHASYLLNLADDGFIGRKSVEALSRELSAAAALGLRGSIVHLGSFKDVKEGQKKNPSAPKTAALPLAKGEPDTGHTLPDSLPACEKHPKFDLLVSNIKAVLDRAPKDTLFIIENSGTRKIGRTVEEMGSIVSDVSCSSKVNGQRLKVCLDTCHLHAAGYDLSTPTKLHDFFERFDETIGLERLEVIHMNDSRDEFGSMRDRHENIGEGKVGREVFRLLLNHPKTRRLPFIIETPGFDGEGPDKKNLDILKSLIQ